MSLVNNWLMLLLSLKITLENYHCSAQHKQNGQGAQAQKRDFFKKFFSNKTKFEN